MFIGSYGTDQKVVTKSSIYSSQATSFQLSKLCRRRTSLPLSFRIKISFIANLCVGSSRSSSLFTILRVARKDSAFVAAGEKSRAFHRVMETPPGKTSLLSKAPNSPSVSPQKTTSPYLLNSFLRSSSMLKATVTYLSPTTGTVWYNISPRTLRLAPRAWPRWQPLKIRLSPRVIEESSMIEYSMTTLPGISSWSGMIEAITVPPTWPCSVRCCSLIMQTRLANPKSRLDRHSQSWL